MFCLKVLSFPYLILGYGVSNLKVSSLSSLILGFENLKNLGLDD